MFDFSHGPNRQLPIDTERLGLSKFLKPTTKKTLIGKLSRVVEHPHIGNHGLGIFCVVRFDLGPLLQGQTRIAKLKSAYSSLIIGPRGLGW